VAGRLLALAAAIVAGAASQQLQRLLVLLDRLLLLHWAPPNHSVIEYLIIHFLRFFSVRSTTTALFRLGVKIFHRTAARLYMTIIVQSWSN
jgi:hypothetical protein